MVISFINKNTTPFKVNSRKFSITENTDLVIKNELLSISATPLMMYTLEVPSTVDQELLTAFHEISKRNIIKMTYNIDDDTPVKSCYKILVDKGIDQVTLIKALQLNQTISEVQHAM